MRRLFLIVIFTLFAGSLTLYADTVKGVVIDKESRTPMLGATIVEKGTTNAVVVDAEGRFELEIGNAPSVNIEISFFAYKTIIIENVAAGSELLVEMEAESEMLEQSIVFGTKTLDNERSLLLERHNSSVSIENIGAKEMGVKGIANVQEGVKKLSGVSIASSGQLIVRGLGDRYSITTLNGMPIASPNPDNK
ncbi:MAG: carboxypeptidase-like regulatory domain-containing protein, partial [Muribaculum sp.]|nr:carboxypeptidase-like regulatory domain-containing protein [Candidatus Merdivivens faecigallinarum]